MMKEASTTDLVLLKGLNILRNLVMNSSQQFQPYKNDITIIFNKLLKNKKPQFLALIFEVLAELSKMDFFRAPQFIAIIVPVFIEKLKTQNDENFFRILQTLEHLMLKEQESSRLTYFNQLSEQLLSISDLELRQPFCQFLNRVYSFMDPHVFRVIQDQNKVQQRGADNEIDSEIFIHSLTSLVVSSSTSSLSLRALFISLLYCIKYQDFAINQVTLEAIDQILRVIALKARQEQEIPELVEEFIQKTIKYFSLHYQSQFVMRSILYILRALLKEVKEISQQKFNSFLSLDCLNCQEETDSPLKALESIQIVSRIKALKEIQEKLPSIESKQIVMWILPILRSMFTIQLQKRKAISSKKETQEAHLLKEVLNTYKASIAYIPLGQTFTIMRSLSLKIKQDSSQFSKAYCKLLCSLIEGIPQKQESKSDRNFYDKLKTTIVPILYSQLRGGDTPYVKYYVVTGIYEIISRITDREEASAHLTRLMNLLSSALTSKEEAVRDKVRETIMQFVSILPESELSLLFGSLCQTLIKGFQRHVLNFTIHRILKTVYKKFSEGQGSISLDRCIPYILPGLKDELFGTLREEKEVRESQAAKQYKEAKGGLAQESLAILAQCINFKQNALTIINPLEEILSSTSNKRVVNRCNQAFQAIVSGFSKNQSISGEDALLFIYGIVQQSHQIEKAILEQTTTREQTTWDAKKKTLAELEAERLQIQQGGGNERRLSKIRQARHPKEYLGAIQILESFALNLFYSLTQKKKINLESKSELEPFVKLILKCTKSKNEKVAINAYKLVLSFLKKRLISEDIPQLLHNSLETLSRLDSRHNKEILGLIMKIIHSSLMVLSPQGVESEMIGEILDSVAHNIDFSQNVYSMFDILDFIISRTFISPKVYDLVERVGLQMVQSFDSKTRQKCSQIYLKFMLTYPLQETRLTQHINFMLKNLNYGRVDGRLQILKNVKQFLQTFPQHVLLPRLQSIFIFLALRFANQEIQSGRSLIHQTLQILINKSDNPSKLLETALLWLQQDNTTKLAFDLLEALHQNKQVQNFLQKHLTTFLQACESKEARLDSLLYEVQESQEDLSSVVASCLKFKQKLLFTFPKEGRKYLQKSNKFDVLKKLFHSVDDFELLQCAVKLQWRVLQTIDLSKLEEDELKDTISSTFLLFNCKFQHDQFSSQLITNLVSMIENIVGRGIQDELFAHIFSEIEKMYSVIFQTEASAKVQGQPLFRFIISFIDTIIKRQKDGQLLNQWAKSFLKLAYRILSDEHYEGSQLHSQAESILDKLKTHCENFSKALVGARKEIDFVRKQRRQELSQMKLNKPEVATLKRIKKQERKKLNLKAKYAKSRLLK